MITRTVSRWIGAALFLTLSGLSQAAYAAPLDDPERFVEDYRYRTVYIEVFEPGSDRPRSTGSGVLLESGYVLTSLHTLIDGDAGTAGTDLAEIEIEGRVGLSEGRAAAKLHFVGEVEFHDLALLQFNQAVSKDFAFVCPRFEQLAQGEPLALLGFPLSGDLLIGIGIVNGLDANLIKTTITATYGHSGAGAFDRNGRLVGILRAEFRKNSEGTDIYAVVPISRAITLLGMVEGEASDGCKARDAVAERTLDAQEKNQLVGLALPPEATNPVAEALSSGELVVAEDELAALEEQRHVLDVNFRQDAKRLMESLLEDGYTFGGVLDRPNRWTQPVIRICFFNGTTQERSTVANIASQWTYYGNLQFDFGSLDSPRTCDPATPSDVRISLGQMENSSRMGRASAAGDQSSPSMRLMDRGSRSFIQYATTVLHEFGHLVGLKHTQAHPEYCRDELDLDVVYAETARMGWTRAMVERNYLATAPASAEIGSFDANSVMSYRLPARYYKQGTASPCFAGEVTGLSPLDKLAMYHMYPFDS